MPVQGEIKGETVTAKIWAPVEEVESGALTQLRNVASLPWVRHVCAMPDIHSGFGPPVGSVIAMKEAVSPYAVGVDIGCGMAAMKLNLWAEQLPDSLAGMRSAIEKIVPVGNGPGGSHEKTPTDLDKVLFASFKDLAVAEHTDAEITARRQYGTLGGGNHFVEVSLDENKQVWVVLHSGSRNIGKRIAEYHVKIAKALEHNFHLPDRDLSVFLNGTPEMAAYRRDLYWAQKYAFENRRAMLQNLRGLLVEMFPNLGFHKPVICHHNYVAEEIHYGEPLFVTRKGAIRAGRGEMGIIPGSMGTRSYIVRGKGSEESLYSASHGAGRCMGREEAKRRYDKGQVPPIEEQLKGVESRRDRGIADELPSAYKDIDKVMANQPDLVEIVATLKAVLCVKG